jgi:hypothetical protein
MGKFSEVFPNMKSAHRLTEQLMDTVRPADHISEVCVAWVGAYDVSYFNANCERQGVARHVSVQSTVQLRLMPRTLFDPFNEAGSPRMQGAYRSEVDG